MATDKGEPAAPNDLQKTQIDYAWKWFAFHADQRVKMFNYMLVVFGIAAAGVVNVLSKPDQVPVWAVSGLCFVTSLLALLFTRLDRRNRDLVWFSEDVLIHLERTVLFGESTEIEGRRRRRVTFGVLWRQERATETAAAPPTGRLEVLKARLADYLSDVMLGKHRVLLPLIGYLLAAMFFIAGLVIPFVMLGPADRAPQPARAVSPPFDPSAWWV